MGHVVQVPQPCDAGLTPGQFRRDSLTLDQGGVPMVSSPPNPLVGNLMPVRSKCAADSVSTAKTRGHGRHCSSRNIRGVDGLVLAGRKDYLLPRGLATACRLHRTRGPS